MCAHSDGAIDRPRSVEARLGKIEWARQYSVASVSGTMQGPRDNEAVAVRKEENMYVVSSRDSNAPKVQLSACDLRLTTRMLCNFDVVVSVSKPM